MTVWTVVVAAGQGTRFGGPKHLEDFGGMRVIDWSLDAADQVSAGVVVVVAADCVASFADSVAKRSPQVVVVAGGDSRSASVRCGLAAVPDSAEVVLVHDGARPLAGALFATVVEAVQGGAAAVVPGVALVDTIRTRSGGVVDRDELVAVQTPQGFNAAVLRAAHASGDDATDDAGLVERQGYAVVVVPGVRENIKITNPEDLAIAHTLRSHSEG